jgi:hypothetical protein
MRLFFQIIDFDTTQKFLFSSLLRKKTCPALCRINFISEFRFLNLSRILAKTNELSGGYKGASEEAAYCKASVL